MQSIPVLHDEPVYLPSLPRLQLQIEAQEVKEFSSADGTELCFAVTVTVCRRDESDPDRTRTFMVMASRSGSTRSPGTMKIEQILHKRSVMASLTAAETHSWLVQTGVMLPGERDRIVIELREAIEPKLKRSLLY